MTAAQSMTVQSSAGRPRLTPRQREGSTAREEILDAAAELFAGQGYAATSTRAIALAVGIKQASLYYHFASKEQILAELLADAVVPSLAAAADLLLEDAPPDAALWALAAFDVRALGSGRWNIGSLYLMPELRSQRFAAVRAQRQQRRDAYEALVTQGSTEGIFSCDRPATATDLVVGLVDSVVPIRADRGVLDPAVLPPAVADGTLRLLAVSARRLASARRRGQLLLDALSTPAR